MARNKRARTSIVGVVLVVALGAAVIAPMRKLLDDNYDWTAEVAKEPPALPTAPVPEAAIAAAIRASDDFDTRDAELLKASRLFLQRGGTLADLRENGGWTRSQAHKPRAVYFTFKAPANRANRFYYDATTGRLFQ